MGKGLSSVVEVLCCIVLVGWLGTPAARAQRVSDGLIALYEFEEGSGLTVGDSGPAPALDLVIDPADLGTKVTWIPNGGLAMNLGSGPVATGGAIPVQSTGPATKIYDRIAAIGTGTQELTVEAWIRPELPDLQSNISRVVSLSIDGSNRNFTLGTTTTGDQYVHRLRTPATGLNGTGGPGQLETLPGGVRAGQLQHVVFTRDPDGEEILYVDNEIAAGPRVVTGDVVPPVGSSAAAAFAEVEALIAGDDPFGGRLEVTAPLLQADFHNSAGDGHFGVNHPVPGLFGDDDDFAIEITGELDVLVAGDYTFVYQGDDGGRLQIDFLDGAGFVDVIDDVNVLHAEQDWGALVTFPAADVYPFRCVAFERGGGATFEWMYARGDRTADFTNGQFNVAQLGGTPIGDNVPAANPGPWYLLGDPLPDAANPGSHAIEVLDGEVTSYKSPVVFGVTDLANWDPSYPLALGDELTVGGRKFNGSYHLVAIYDRALSAAEVAQNFEQTEFSPCLPIVERTIDPNSFDAGDEVLVTLTATNLLEEATVTDTFPAGWTVVSDGGGTVDENTITFRLAADGSVTYSLTAPANIAASFQGTVTTTPAGCEPVELAIGGDGSLTRLPPDPPGDIPVAEAAADLGFPAIPGTNEFASEDPLAINLWASGADIWGTADEGRMVSFGEFDTFDIQSSVEFFGSHPWGKAGLMVRTSIDDASSAYAFLHISGANGTDFQYRDDFGFNAANRGQTGAADIQRELRLVRRTGTLVEAFARNPGEMRWQLFATRDMTALGVGDVGLAVTSHDNTELAAASFRDIAISDDPPPPLPAITDLECTFGATLAELTFTTSVTVDVVEIWRDGVLIDVLPGEATGYTDSGEGAATAFGYTVQTYDESSLPGPTASCARREVLALYDFEEGDGVTVEDRSTFGEPYDLTIQDPFFAEWGDGYLSINQGLGTLNTGGTIIANPGVPTTKLFDVITLTQEVSVEVWVQFERNDLTANPTRMVTYSDPANGPGNRHFTVGSLNTQFAARFRSTTNGTNGSGGPNGQLLGGTVRPDEVQHVVFTRAADGQESLWIDGVLAVTRPRTGDLSNWPDLNGATYELALAQEHGLERRFAGDLYRVAIFSYALNAEEVDERFSAGPDDDDGPPQIGFRRGDVDGNASLEITDPINNLSYQFLGDFEPPCLDALDWDDSGAIDISDPIGNLSHQFLGDPEPPPPGKDTCGRDPTPDAEGDLGCENPPDNC